MTSPLSVTRLVLSLSFYLSSTFLLFTHLSFVRVYFLPQQHLEAVAVMQQVEDVRHLVVPADARQQAHLRSLKKEGGSASG